MFQDAFIKLDRKECETVLGDITPALSGSVFEPDTVTMLGQELSFYPGYRFIDIADYEVTPHLRKFVIYKPGDVVALDWTNKPVYALNDRVPIGLTPETVLEYVRFFFTYVRGPHGRFIFAEMVDDIPWREDPPPAARKAMGGLLEAVTLHGRNGDGAYNVSACMVFKDTLYKTGILVAPDGRITMNNEEILIGDLPVQDDMLGQ